MPCFVFVKAQAGLLLLPPPSTVAGFQDSATQPMASLPQAPKIPLSGLQHGTTALLQCSQFQLSNPCLWAGSSPTVPNPGSDLGTPRSLGSHRPWNCWADRAGRKMGHHGKGDRCHVCLALDTGVELSCNRQISRPATPEKRFQTPGGFSGGGQSPAVYRETERRETSPAQAPELSLSLHPHMKEKSSPHEPQRHGVKLFLGNPQSYNFVQRGCIKPQFLSLENGASAYFTVLSGGLRKAVGAQQLAAILF